MQELTCDDVKKNLSAYFDNEVEEEIYSNIEFHLRHCADCRKELEKTIKVSNSLRAFNQRIQHDLFGVSGKVIYRLYNEKALSCKEIQAKLPDYINGNLNILDYYKMEEHINNCTVCKKELNKNKSAIIHLVPVEENNSSCEYIKPRLVAFIDKDLTKEESAIIAKHLLSCTSCRESYDNLKTTRKVILDYLNKNKKISNLTISNFIGKKNIKKIIILSAAFIILLLLGFFSVGLINNISNAQNKSDIDKMTQPEKPIYVNLKKLNNLKRALR